MAQFLFKNVCLESWAVHLPEHEVTSAELEDQIAPIYQNLGIPFGTLEKLSGVKTRRLWDRSVLPSHGATAAAKIAIEQMGIPLSSIGAVFSCSVTRDYFEPATATLVHRNLELPESTMALDITNACIGFSNGLTFMANLIESGVIEAGIVVSCETVSSIIDSSVKAMRQRTDISRDELLKLIPTFTLGSGAVAYILCNKRIASRGHKLLGGVAYTASEHNQLCIGNADWAMTQPAEELSPLMHTESSLLIAAAAKLGGRTWSEASKVLGWKREQIDHIFCHQVGKQVNEAFYREMQLDYEKEFTIYRTLGNLVSAALPTNFAIGIEQKGIKRGEKILLTAFGSGLNSIFLGLEW